MKAYTIVGTPEPEENILPPKPVGSSQWPIVPGPDGNITRETQEKLRPYEFIEIPEEKMSRERSLRQGASLMLLGALIFLVYAVVFFFRAFASSGFEVGVQTLDGVTRQQLNELNPAIVYYITHLHVATAGFIAATAIAAGGLAWYGIRSGLWWAWITGVIVPVVGLAVALPLHYMGHFNYNWVTHLGPVYIGTIIYVLGAVVALVGLSRPVPGAAQAAP